MAARSGSTSGANVVQIKGLREFRAALRDIDKRYPIELRRAYKRIADKAARWSQAEAGSMGGVHAKAASAIKGYATQTSARIGVSPSKSTAMANVAFWGAKARTGWYAQARYAGGPLQHPSWVGNAWDVARRGEGPYAINDALADHEEELVDEFADATEEVARAAFPS